jgi:membrane fusion protein
MTDSRLFRDEAIQAQTELLLGRTHCILPLSTRLMAYGFFGLAILAMAYGTWGSYTRRVSVSGMVQPSGDVLRIYAPQPGVVLARHAVEGSAVRKGALLFTLSSERQSALGPTQGRIAETLQLRLQSYAKSIEEQRRLTLIQRRDLSARLTLLAREIDQAQQEHALQQKRLMLADKTRQRFEALAQSGFVSPLQLQQKDEERLEVERGLTALSRSLSTLRREQGALMAEHRALPLKLQSQESEFRRSAEALRQDLAHHEALREIRVVAPEDGTLTSVNTHPGSPATPLQPLAVLVPSHSGMEAHLFAPSRAIGFIRVGARVKLRFEAFPYQKFGHARGTVVAVSRTAMQPGEWADQPDSKEPLYRIRVKLAKPTILAYGMETPLLPSMRLEGDVMLETRRLVEWALEPLFSITGKW